MEKIKSFVSKNKISLSFFSILLLGLYLRFWSFENSISFGWDQARDAWKTRDILTGQIVLNGPRTGVGHFHLGPLWYYLLVPFYRLTNFDPVGAIYLNILVNIFNLFSIFWVTKKIYNTYAALFVALIYATSRYLIEITRTPWNVSPVLGVTALIFYCVYGIVFNRNYKLVPLLAFLTGLFSHLHFAVVFLIPIILASLLFVKEKKTVFFRGLASLPLFLIWLVPNIIYDIQTKNSNLNLFQSFLKDYYVGGFHARFFIYRLHDAFVQFQTVIFWPLTQKFLKFIVPIIFGLFILFEKDKKKRLFGCLISLWFIIPAFIYALYGGSTSEYYVLLNALPVLYILVYIQEKLLKLKHRRTVLLFLILVWGFFIYHNTNGIWIKPSYGGLAKQKADAKWAAVQGSKIEFNEGVIESYLYHIWTVDGKKF